jgi:sugar phosphate permease
MWTSTEIQRTPVKLVFILAMLAVLGYITLLPATYVLPGYGALILFSAMGFLIF